MRLGEIPRAVAYKMDEQIEKTIEELDNRRSLLLQTICENEAVWQPQLIIQIVHDIRAITRTIRMLKGEKGRFE